MMDLSQIWLCGSDSEVIRADHLTSLFVSDGDPSDPGDRASESNTSGVLWAHVVGRAEPVRIGGFTGVRVGEVIDATVKAIAELVRNSDAAARINQLRQALAKLITKHGWTTRDEPR